MLFRSREVTLPVTEFPPELLLPVVLLFPDPPGLVFPPGLTVPPWFEEPPGPVLLLEVVPVPPPGPAAPPGELFPAVAPPPVLPVPPPGPVGLPVVVVADEWLFWLF